jgi:nitrogen fixation/metabolism regulation signal transduction histidine kinase
MDFKRHKLSTIGGMVLLLISATLLGWAFSSARVHLAILLAIAMVLESVFLYRQFTRTMEEVLFFFKALENDDTSIHYSSPHRSSLINELHHHLNRLNKSYGQMRLSNELREQYFSSILENLSSGLMVISGTGYINHINEEALRLLNMSKLTHIKALSAIYPELYGRIFEIHFPDRSELELKDKETGLKRVLGLQMVEINLKGDDVRVVSMHDLSAGMERKEINDWIRLIRVMSHEIMNSLAPITSISTTLKELWAENEITRDPRQTSEASIQKTLKGLDAIAEQSEGLTTFFESYRVLSRIPDPVKKEFGVGAMLEKLETLVTNNQENAGVKFIFSCEDSGLKLLADEQMISQVMLNLLRNAVQATAGIKQAEIGIVAESQDKHIVLMVSDNGEGIPAEISDEIFMPFFTTRAKGTGVGLSYSRQVMAMNGGRIEYNSQPGNTQFRLVF